jgi:hypothetical protein
MLPAIRRIDRWERGVNFELVHSVEGHDVPLQLRVNWGLFHLRESLWPGLGTPLFALGLIGLAAPLIAARERRMPLFLVAGFTLLWYAVHEATPLKPFPDYSRYILPLVPLFVIPGTSFIYKLSSRLESARAHRGDRRPARRRSGAIDVVADQFSRRRSAHDHSPTSRRAGGIRSLLRLPAERPQNPWVTRASNQGHGRLRGHVESGL